MEPGSVLMPLCCAGRLHMRKEALYEGFPSGFFGCQGKAHHFLFYPFGIKYKTGDRKNKIKNLKIKISGLDFIVKINFSSQEVISCHFFTSLEKQGSSLIP